MCCDVRRGLVPDTIPPALCVAREDVDGEERCRAVSALLGNSSLTSDPTGRDVAYSQRAYPVFVYILVFQVRPAGSSRSVRVFQVRPLGSFRFFRVFQVRPSGSSRYGLQGLSCTSVFQVRPSRSFRYFSLPGTAFRVFQVRPSGSSRYDLKDLQGKAFSVLQYGFQGLAGTAFGVFQEVVSSSSVFGSFWSFQGRPAGELAESSGQDFQGRPVRHFKVSRVELARYSRRGFQGRAGGGFNFQLGKSTS